MSATGQIRWEEELVLSHFELADMAEERAKIERLAKAMGPWPACTGTERSLAHQSIHHAGRVSSAVKLA
ncbi:hypothetical protein [Acidisoma sp. L85]|uniref:hypothetical protein n=1 Tax=Acidisoma sp. L85 TaxID=1641850 RepID=UPI00131CAD9B|nr:hypothetical protein [Acidisoma sp. L85]